MTSKPTAFAEMLRLQRIVACKTQAQVAQELGVNQATISLWERGKFAPALRHRQRLARALGVDHRLLFPAEAA